MSLPTRPSAPVSEFSIHGHLLACAAIILVLVGGVGGWAATANLGGAVIAGGTVVVERNVKKIQHGYGGIVAEINVRNGDRVAAGDVLVRLDPTQLQAELGVIEAQIVELSSRSARLRAERDGAAEITWPAWFLGSSRAANAAAAGEQRLFLESRKVKLSQKEQLRQKRKQIQEEIAGIDAQSKAKAAELQIIGEEFRNVHPLVASKVVTVTKGNSLERELRRIEGEHGSLISQRARASAQISEIELQILGIDENVIANAQRELVIAEGKLAELTEKAIASRDRLSRTEIRSPVAGVVHELGVHTVGGVVSTAEQLMLIVPKEDKLTVQARIQPNEVDQVKVGRTARMRFTAFNQQTTPEVEGLVVYVASDITTDSKTGGAYYMVLVELTEEARNKLENLKLLPGMPVEAYLSTGERTVLSYLTKPFTDQMKRAFRE